MTHPDICPRFVFCFVCCGLILISFPQYGSALFTGITHILIHGWYTWRHIYASVSQSRLSRVILVASSVPCHYLNQCWLISNFVSKVFFLSCKHIWNCRPTQAVILWDEGPIFIYSAFLSTLVNTLQDVSNHLENISICLGAEQEDDMTWASLKSLKKISPWFTVHYRILSPRE